MKTSLMLKVFSPFDQSLIDEIPMDGKNEVEKALKNERWEKVKKQQKNAIRKKKYLIIVSAFLQIPSHDFWLQGFSILFSKLQNARLH